MSRCFFHGRALRISIFMNVFDVHVNRYPVSGVVRYMHYNPGKFLNAAAEKSSLDNEQQSVGIAMTGDRRVAGAADCGTHRAADRHLQPDGDAAVNRESAWGSSDSGHASMCSFRWTRRSRVRGRPTLVRGRDGPGGDGRRDRASGRVRR